MIIRDLLGTILIRLGYVSQGQLEEALTRQKKEMEEYHPPESLRREKLVSDDRRGGFGGDSRTLGDILQRMGLINRDQLEKALQVQKESLAKVDTVEARKLAQIIELGSLVNSTLNISKVLQSVMDLANGVTDALASTLMLLDQETGELVFSVPTGPKSTKLVDIRIPKGTGIAGWVAENNKPLLIPDVSKDERFFGGVDDMIGFKTESILCVPLSAKGKVIGVLEAINKEDGSRFTKDDELLLGIFATQAAMAIENARLYSELNLNLRDLEEKQEVLQNSEFKYRVVSELTTDFSFCLKKSPQGRFETEWVTSAFERITGRSENSFKNLEDWLNLVHPEDRVAMENKLSQLMDGSPSRGDVRMITGSGRTIWLRLTCHSLPQEGGQEVERLIGAAQEITDQVLAGQENERLERLLRQSQKMQALGTLTGGIAHDFNNILQTIGGSAQLISMSETNPENRKYIAQIESASQRASDLVNRLLTFSRDMKPNLVCLDLNQELQQIVEILDRTIPKMIRLECHLDPDLHQVIGDSNQLHQLVLNLTSNAKDALPDGGLITIATQNIALDSPEPDSPSGLPPGDYIRLTISDNGVGMDAETRERMFEPFFTTKPLGKGTGLGLSSVYGIVEGHNGRITCSSESGRGTSFRIDLPAVACLVQPLEDDPDKPVEKPLGGEMETVLVVDDEPLVIEVVRDVLTQSGYRVRTATSGEEALEAYEAVGSSIDLVLLDLNMPGMGGRKTLELLLKNDPLVKVIIASGYSVTDKDSALVGKGASGYINKPYRLVDLLKKIRETLDA